MPFLCRPVQNAPFNYLNLTLLSFFRIIVAIAEKIRLPLMSIRANNLAIVRLLIISNFNNPKSKMALYILNIQTIVTGTNF
jgi:hypothetical protein